MSEFIEMLRNRLAEVPDEWVFKSNASRYHGHGYRLRLDDVMKEVDAIIAERDALRTEVARYIDTLQTLEGVPPRRLREYKGVTYRDGTWRYDKDPRGVYVRVVDLISIRKDDFTDADHAALLALRDDPWEKVETLEEVVTTWHDAHFMSHSKRPAQLEDLCTRIRAWLAAQEPTP